MNNVVRCFVTTFAAGISALAVSPSGAASPTSADLQPAPVVSFYVVDQALSYFFDEMERVAGVRIQSTDKVRGRIQSEVFTGTLDEVLDEITRANGLEWYRFNGVIFVSARSESGLRVVSLGDLLPLDAINAIRETGLPIDKFPAQVAGERRAIVLTGPPTFLALAEAVVETLPQLEAAVPKVEGASVVVRRGIETEIVRLRQN